MANNDLSLDIWPHPLTAAGRTRQTIAIAPGATVADVMAQVVATQGHSLLVTLDGRHIEQQDWQSTRVSPNQIISVRAIVHGGDDSNPLAIILIIALIVAAPYLAAGFSGGGAFAGAVAEGAIAAHSIGYHIAYAAVLTVGSLVINQIAPPRLPSAPDAAAAADEIFSLSGGANNARLYAPVMLVIGRHRVFPDLGAKEYTDLRGDDLFLAQSFDFGYGQLDLAEIKIGDTAIDAYAAVQQVFSDYQNDYARQDLIAGNVDSISVGALDDSNFVWIERTTSQDTLYAVLDFNAQQGSYDKKGRKYRHSAYINIEWRETGSSSWIQAATIALTGYPTDPIRISRRLQFPQAGRYDIRCKRDRPAVTGNDRRTDDISWSQLKSFQPDDIDYPGRTRLALRIRASRQLQGRIERLSAIATQQMPVWRGGEWSAETEQSSNPAALLRWYCLGILAAGKLVAGVGLAPGRIDDAGLGAWHERCESLALECNFVITGLTSHDQVINTICQAGDAAPTWATGRLGVVYAEDDDPVTALFTPGNIIAGTLAVHYASQPPTEIAVQYIEPNNDWQSNTIRRAVPGAAAGQRTVSISLRGVTSAAQASREANALAARQFYHRRRLSWDVALKGMAVTRGDVVFLASDLVSGGDGGRLLPGSTADTLQLSRPVNRSDNAADYVILAPPVGEMIIREVSAADAPGAAAALALAEPLPTAPGGDGDNAHDWLYKFYRGGEAPLRVRIVGVEPRSTERVRLTAIDEVDEYYAAVAGVVDAFSPRPATRPEIIAINITESLLLAGNSYAVRFELRLAVAGDYRGAAISVGYDDGPQAVVAQADGTGAASWIGPADGRMKVTATPGTAVAASGDSLTIEHDIRGKLWPPGDAEDFYVAIQNDGTREFAWSTVEDPDLAGYQIRYAATRDNAAAEWITMTPLHDGLLTETNWEVNRPAAGAWTFAIKAVDTSGVESSAARYIQAELADNRLGYILFFQCESALGWPGFLKNGLVDHDSSERIVALRDFSWDDLGAWQDFTAWRGIGVGHDGDEIGGAGNADVLEYCSEILDIGAAVSFSPTWNADTNGEFILETRVGDTLAEVEAAAFVIYDDTSVLLFGRFLQLKWLALGPGANDATLANLCWSLRSPSSAVVRLNDVDTATWMRGAGGGRVAPHSLTIVTDINIVLQNVGPGWSSEVKSKSPAEIALYDAAGNIADATVDVTLHGVNA